MKLIDADKFLSYLIFSKHIDGLTCGEVKEAVKMCEVRVEIEQEPCEDAISREDVINLKWQGEASKEFLEGYANAIEDARVLPPVKPQESREVLYSGDGYADGYMVYDMAECPNCGYEYKDGDKDWGLSFCPNCGQKLNWESEDEE